MQRLGQTSRALIRSGPRRLVYPGAGGEPVAGIPGRTTSTFKKLRRLFREECERAGVVCWLDGEPIDYAAPAFTPDAFELDHFHPVKTHPELAEVWENFRPAHHACNRRRSKTPGAASGIGRRSRSW